MADEGCYLSRGKFHSKTVQKALDLPRVTPHAIKTYNWFPDAATLAPIAHELRRQVHLVHDSGGYAGGGVYATCLFYVSVLINFSKRSPNTS
jgi:hypothetical protein